MSLMQLYTELDVVNDMLGLMGESPVSTLDEDHPLVPTARSTLRTTNATTQAAEWWFNVEFPVLTPQTDGRIYLPNNTTSADSLTEYPRLTVRGNTLYNLDAGTDQFTSRLKVRLHRVVDFEAAPLSMRAFVAAQAKLKFVRAYDGDKTKLQLLMDEVKETRAATTTEHIRNASVNLLNRTGVVTALSRARGNSRNLYNQGETGQLGGLE